MSSFDDMDAFEGASLSARAMAARPAPYLDDLNPAQREAVERLDGPVLMLAGAGTGKTKALTSRIVHLLVSGKARPNEILSVTFTNKAAREMKTRVGRLLGQQIEGMPWLGTFHAICVKLLRRHAELAGLKSNFTILDTDDQIRLLKQLLAVNNIDEKRWPARQLSGLIDHWKNRAWTPSKVPASEASAFNHVGTELYEQYQTRLRELNACDFGDLLLHVVTIFQAHPDILEQYQRWFRYILVDEYQDTNVAQYLWLRLLAGGHKNICCVGDDDQSIYGWRGAEVGNILRFEEDFPGAEVVRLERNYRSTGHILGAASGLIAHNTGRLGKTLWTEDADGEKVSVTGCWDGDEEARIVGEAIEDLQRAGESIEQALEALRFAVDSMGPEDEFNIVDYGTTVEAFAEAPVKATEIIRAAALEYIDGIVASGGTNIHGALLEATGMLAGDEFAEMIVFLTDGIPTIGEIELEAILGDVSAANETRARLFVFGVGHEVNTHLLDRLAGDNGGASTYVTPGENIEVAVSTFYTKVSNPVLTKLKLEVEGGRLRDFYPRELPNLFRGAQIVQLGRLEVSGNAVVVELSGDILGDTQVFTREISIGDGGGGAEFLPRLWATRKVGFLLDQIRLHGEEEELVDEIVALSRRYGIITPYTSFLIVEDDLVTPIAEDTALRDQSGAEAVRASEDVASYAEASTTTRVRSLEVRYVGDKTFYLRDGFWEDSQYDHSLEARAVGYGTEGYFRLLRDRPALGRFLALGKNIRFKSGEEQFRIDNNLPTIVEEAETLPNQPELEQNFPNPFNPGTTIRFELKEGSAVSVEVFDLTGQRVRTLADLGPLVAGHYEVAWDGRDERGEAVASGVYLYALSAAGSRVVVRKMVLMK